MRKIIVATTLAMMLGTALVSLTRRIDGRASASNASPSPLAQSGTTISINDASLEEGNTGTSNMVFTVSLTASGAHPPIGIQHTTADGPPPNGATAPSDYTNTSGQLVFLSGTGNATMTISVPIIGDTIDEPDETFFVNLTLIDPPASVVLTDGLGVGTIINNDSAPALPALSISDVSVNEGNAGTVDAIFTVSLSAASSSEVTVSYATADGTATVADNDYASRSGTVTFPAGDSSPRNIAVPVTGDTRIEADETFFVNLNSPTGGTISDGQGVCTIFNDDGSSLPILSINNVFVSEGNTANSSGTGGVIAVFTVNLSAASTSAVTVDYATVDGTATQADNDYLSISGTLTFNPGDAFPKTISVPIVGDTRIEPDETFSVNLMNPQGGATIRQPAFLGVGTIFDDDDGRARLPVLSLNHVRIAEGNSGTVDAVFTVNLSSPGSSPIVATYQTREGRSTVDSATLADNDFVSRSGTVTFPAGDATPKIFSIPVVGDTRNEFDEIFFVDLNSSALVTISGFAECLIINDDDSPSPPIVSITDASTLEGERATFRLSLSASSTSPVTVNYQTADGTATVADNDYISAASTLTIPAGARNGFLFVPTVGDDKAEPDETFLVLLTGAVGAAVGDGEGVCTITTDELGCTFSVDPEFEFVSKEGGSFFVFVEAPNNCSWNVMTIDDVPWISVIGGESQRRGTGVVDYQVQPNLGGRRDVRMIIAGQLFRVIQDAGNCTFTISPTNSSVGPDGGVFSLTVTAPTDCLWRATIPDDFEEWLQFPFPSRFERGRGTGSFTYSVSPNYYSDGTPGPWRFGYISVNQDAADGIEDDGPIHQVQQHSPDCVLEVICRFFPDQCGAGLDLAQERSFRDKVLARTPRGQRYSDLYYRFSTEAVGIVMLNPMLVLRSREMMQRYMPVVQSMVRGEQVTLTEGDIEEIDGFLRSFADKGSPEMKATVKSLSEDLRDPQIHMEFNINVAEGPKRELSKKSHSDGFKQMSGFSILFGFALGGVFLAEFRRRKRGRTFLCITFALLLTAYGQPSVAAPAAQSPAPTETTAGASEQLAELAGNRSRSTLIATPSRESAGSERRAGLPWPLQQPSPIAFKPKANHRRSQATDQLQLTADARLAFSTYFGGGKNEEGNSIAVDSAGNVYITGFTDSDNFPLANASQPNFGGGQQDAFVAKLDPSGRLVYSTYIGGNGQDNGTSIAVDNAGNAYITGFTGSTNFPVKDALQPTKTGAFNAFIVKLDPSGSILNSTLLGGNVSDYGSCIAVDNAGNVFVAGIATSPNFPTANPIQQSNGGLADMYVAKLDLAAKTLFYSTYLGASGIEGASSIAVDSAGSVYLTGLTSSADFRTFNPLQAIHGGGVFDAFVTKLDPSGTQIVYSTYLGGAGEDRAFRIAVDSAGSVYVTGDTDSNNFPLANAVQRSRGGGADAFVAKLNPKGDQLVYSTYLGGNGMDGGTAISVDSTGSVHLTGFTASTNFPSVNPIQRTSGGSYDGFVAKLNASGSSLDYSTYLGGDGVDSAFGVAVDSVLGVHIMGVTSSTNFPTMNPLHPLNGGGTADIFIAKIELGPVVTGAIVSGKKLLVFGSGFDQGARISLNGQPQKTINDRQNPTTSLVGKTAGKKIFRGETVALEVRNSDGALSNEFSFTRPVQ